MLRKKMCRIWTAALVCMNIAAANAVVLTVSKSGDGMFSSIQEAVDAARPGSEIIILDNGVYEEQVTIDSTKRGLVLRSSQPTSANRRPVIQFMDDINVNPKNYQETQDPETINYDRNGALRLINVRNVVIDGLIIDGGGANPFGYSGVWEGRHPLFHGNAALCIYHSGEVVIRNSEMRNAYFGIALRDVNQGGVYGNSNPADFPYADVVPLSGFGKTGDHLIEHNRIHGNSWGIYMESVWDLGSTIRFNLIYNNYHQTSSVVSLVNGLPDGEHQAGGAILTMDHMLSPLAIYNNTFHNNYLLFAGYWRSGAHHLVFNNIYSKPAHYWSDGYHGEFTNPFHAMDPSYVNRMKHSVYSTQMAPPQIETRMVSIPDGCMVDTLTRVEGVSRVRIMNGIDDVVRGSEVAIECTDGSEVLVTVPDFIQPGALIEGRVARDAFPSSAQNRWIEMQDHFKSLDPSDPHFLEPDWNDPVVSEFIKNGGCPEAGVVKANGTIADIGALQYSSMQNTHLHVRPIAPVAYDDGIAHITFDLSSSGGEFSNPEIRYVRWLRDVPFDGDAFANNAPVISENDIIEIDVPSTQLRRGHNTLTFEAPEPGEYAFFELVVETDVLEGKAVSNVAFFPYRELHHQIEIELFDIYGNKIEDQAIRVGDPVIFNLRVILGDEFSEPNLNVDYLTLNSGGKMYKYSDTTALTIGDFTGTFSDTVFFTEAPNLGTEYISAFVVWSGSAGDYIIFGNTEINIEPAEPVGIGFQLTGRGMFDDTPLPVRPNSTNEIRINLFDTFSNYVNQEFSVEVMSLDESIAQIEGSAYKNMVSLNKSMSQIGSAGNISSEENGYISFNIRINDATDGEEFSIVAHVEELDITDTVTFVINSSVSVRREVSAARRNSEALIEIVDLRGRVIQRFKGDPNNRMFVRNKIRRGLQGRGVYIMRVTDLKTGKQRNRQLLDLKR
ncbi:hypothetical protein QA601_12880 [Chitinispirillales bacterium ANBcel5]|uniref:hypothetical protein n=1 Tax=Cellulosispirillum alkaliphilum TaxID=3039283 RepID=UPI002A56C32C|nr:hypothetical protein [Chitinispirillales bacterium ANBcel5]